MDELERFKTEINLSTYLLEVEGFTIDKTKSTASEPVLRHPNGEKLRVSRKPNSHYVFRSCHDDTHQGTIIDYVQNAHNLTLGHVRKLLRGYVPQVDFKGSQAHIKPIQRDIRATGKEIEDFKPLTSQYLQNRGIAARVLEHDRFAKRILQDQRGNSIFPHANMQGLCGYEMKNRGFTGFSKGGVKGLWYSNHKPEDTELAFFETGIDALSYATAHPEKLENTTFYSLAGNPHNEQLNLITATIGRFSELEAIILGFDNDKDGHKLAEKVKQHLEGQGVSLPIIRDHPPQPDSDWNDYINGLNYEHESRCEP